MILGQFDGHWTTFRSARTWGTAVAEICQEGATVH